LAHTYLFVGPEGCGKRTFAVQLAQCLLCNRYPEAALDACGECAGCKQVAARTHPDFFLVECPEGKRELPIELFLGPPERRGKAGLCHELSFTPRAGGRKIALIDDADLLNEASANALLKTLEEPPPHALLILIAANADAILPTIRSRCQTVRFAPLAASEVCELLLRTGLTDDRERATEAAALSEGSLTAAAQLLEPELRTQRDLLYDGLGSERFNSVGLASRMLEAVEASGSDTASQRQYAAWLIRFCVAFYRGALCNLAGGRPEVMGALSPQGARFAARFNPESTEHLEVIAALMERSILAETHLERNTGVNLCLETLFDDLGRITRSA
jgi:DNA polymerase-3 subunit delta'